MTHWLVKIWQFAIGKITSQELLTDPDCATESAKSVSASSTSSHARDGVINLWENPSTISSLVLLLGLISRFPTNELRVATNAPKRLRIDNDSVTMSKNQLRCPRMPLEFGTNPARYFESGNSWPKFWTVQNFWAEFPMDLRIARTVYWLCESVRIFTNWVRFRHESKYLSIRGNSWDSGPVWNRGIHVSWRSQRYEAIHYKGDESFIMYVLRLWSKLILSKLE